MLCDSGHKNILAQGQNVMVTGQYIVTIWIKAYDYGCQIVFDQSQIVITAPLMPIKAHSIKTVN